MGSIADTLARIRRLHPGAEDRIDRAFWSDPTFRGLCEDYGACLDALARLRREKAPGVRQRRLEYLELLEGLGEEIRLRAGLPSPATHGDPEDPRPPRRGV